jgi:hypothetical protein
MKENVDVLLEISRIKTMMGIFMENEDNQYLFESQNPISQKVITPAIELICKRFGLTTGEITAEGFLSEVESQILGKRLSGVTDELSDLSKAIKRGAPTDEINTLTSRFLGKPINYTTILRAFESTHPVRFQKIVDDTIEAFFTNNSVLRNTKESLISIYIKNGTKGLIDALKAVEQKTGVRILTDENKILWESWHPGVHKPWVTPEPLVSALKWWIDSALPKALGGKVEGASDAAVTYLRVIKRSWTPITKLRKEFQQVAIQASEKLMKFPPEPVDFEYKRMADILASMNKRGKGTIDFKRAFEGPGGLFTILPDTIKKDIKDNNTWKQAYELIIKLTTDLDEAGGKVSRGVTYNLTTLDWRAMKEMLFLGAQKGFKAKMTAASTRYVNTIATVNPLTFKESLESLMHRGTNMNTVFMTVGRGIIHSFIIPGFAAFMVTNLEMLVSALEAANISLKNQCKKMGINTSNWKEFDFVDFNDGDKIDWVGDFWERYKSYIPENWYNAFLDVTYMDEVIRAGSWLKSNKGKDEEIIRTTEQESCENLMKTIREDTTKVFKKMGCDVTKDCEFNRKKIAEYIDKNKTSEPTPTPTPTPTLTPSPDGDTSGSYDSFKQFCKSQNPPLTPDADTGNVGIYTVGGVEYEWDGTTFKILR